MALRFVFAGPLVTAILAAGYSLVAIMFLMVRREERLGALVQACALRLEGRVVELGLWGFAVLALTLLVGINLIRVHVVALLGIVVLILGLFLLALALVSVSVHVARRWRASFGTAETVPIQQDLGTGFILLAGASAIPILGWIVGGALLLTGLGSVVEYLTVSRRRTSPLVGAEDIDQLDR